MNHTGIFDLTRILIFKKLEKEFFFESSVLAWIRIRIEQKCWIQIRIKSIRTHNPAVNNHSKLPVIIKIYLLTYR
jgi:hypothetical protein